MQHLLSRFGLLLAPVVVLAGCADGIDATASPAQSQTVNANTGVRVKPRVWFELDNFGIDAWDYVSDALSVPRSGAPTYPYCGPFETAQEVVDCLMALDPNVAYRTSITAITEAPLGDSCRSYINGVFAQHAKFTWTRGSQLAWSDWCIRPRAICPDNCQIDTKYDPAVGQLTSCLLLQPDQASADAAPESCPAAEGFSPETGALALVTQDYASIDGDLDFTRTWRSRNRTEFHAANVTQADLTPGFPPNLEAPTYLMLDYYVGSQSPPAARHGSFEVMEHWNVDYNKPLGIPEKIVMHDEDGERIRLLVDAASKTAVTAEPIPEFVAVVPTGSTGYLVSSAAGEQFKLDNAGRVLEKQLESGSVVKFEYDAAGHLAKKRNNLGREVQFFYDQSGQLSQFVDESNNIINYQYQNGRVSQVDYPDGRSLRYLYDEPELAPKPLGLITGRVEVFAGVERRLSTIRYNSEGEPTSTVGPAGSLTTEVVARVPVDASRPTGAAYQPGVDVTVRDASGTVYTERVLNVNGKAHVLSMDQPPGAGCDAARLQRFLDDSGRVKETIDFNGNKTCLDRNPSARMERVSENVAATTNCDQRFNNPFGWMEADLQHQPDARVTWTKLHPNADLPVLVAEPGLLTERIYNGQPPLQMDRVKATPGPAGEPRFCAPLEAVGADGRPRLLLCELRVTATLDPNGQSGFAPLRPAPGTPGFSESVIKYTYNTRGQLIQIDDNGRITKREYHEVESVDARVGDLASETDPAGRVTRFLRYDRAGRVLLAVDADGVTVETAYDIRGRVERLTKTMPDGATPQVVRYTYFRGSDQVETITYPDGSTVTYAYDDALRLLRTTDVHGNVFSTDYDTAGRVVRQQVRDAAGVLWRDVNKSYDALGRVQFVSGDQ